MVHMPMGQYQLTYRIRIPADSFDGIYNSMKNLSTGPYAVKMILPEGSFLLWLDFRATGLSHKQIQEKLLHEAKLGLNSGMDFGPEGEGFFRMNIGCPLDTVKEGLERLKKAFK